ncbi:MAG: hypothetical protein HYZ37_00315 [Candidatus Solibacter usitatus]|nr:hypothetical protein [Candidatus Solibacter usitatus]
MLLLAVAVPAFTQETPFIFRGGVVNAASLTPNELPGGGVAPGSVITISGRRLGPGRDLSGVSIDLRKGTTELSARPILANDSQISAILPANTPTGDISLRLSVNGQKSNWVPLRVVDRAPGIFTATGLGRGWAISQKAASSGGSIPAFHGGTNSAIPGQAAMLLLTGAGVNSFFDVFTELYIGGSRVTRMVYSGRAPGMPGVDQLVFFIPDDAPMGCFVPVYVRVGGVVSNSTTMAIMPKGGACSDTHNPIAESLVKGGKIVHGLLFHASANVGEAAGMSVSLAIDKGSVRAMEERGGPFAFDPFLAMPPAGACTSYAMSGNILATGFQMSSPGKALDLGKLSTNMGDRDMPFTELIPGVYTITFGGGLSARDAPSLRASGGADVRPFDLPVATGPVLDSPNLEELSNIDRMSGANISWKGQPGVSAFLAGAVYDLPTNSSGLFLCVSAPGASMLSIPDYVLANLPPTRATNQNDARVFFSALPMLRATSLPDLLVFSARQDLTFQPIRSVR